jgi:transcriptional regulator with XRE-family HTH domain
MADIQGDDIGKNIKEHRSRQGMSLADLGAMVGVSGQAIYQYESGKRSLKTEMVEKIAKALEVPVFILLGSRNLVSGRSKKVSALPLKWSTVLNLRELLAPSGEKDEDIERILQDHDVQLFLYGFFMRLKKLSDTDRFLLMQYLTEIIERDATVDELESVSIVASRLHELNDEGLAHVNRLIEDVSELPRYRKPEEQEE